MLLRDTTVRCGDCRALHPAVIERDAGRVVGKFACNGDERVAVLSDDAELFESISRKSRVDLRAGTNGLPTRALVNLIEITDTCNFTCPLCYAGCSPQQEPDFASTDYVAEKIRQVKARGARGVTLTGGEPTEHPDLVGLIGEARRLGVRVVITTNGYRLGTEKGYAAALARAGLGKASIQLDSFDPKVHRQIRGNEYLAEKRQAFENARDAGLRLGMIATVSHLNVAEVPQLLEFALGHAPVLNSAVFQMAANVGRYKLPAGRTVYREEVIRNLVAGGAVPGMSIDNFWPLPVYRPWGMHVHPDCGVNAYVLTDGGRRGLLDEHTSLERLFDRLEANRSESSLFTRNAIPLYHALAATRPTRRPALLAHVRGFSTGKGKRGIVAVGVGGFARPEFDDQARIEHCSTTIATEDGPLSPCLRFN